MNVVICVHPGSSGRFMFKAPDDLKLSAGDFVLCNTKREPMAIAMCITDSFEPKDPDRIAQLWGSSTKGLRPVIGRLEPVMFAYEPAEEPDPADDSFD